MFNNQLRCKIPVYATYHAFPLRLSLSLSLSLVLYYCERAGAAGPITIQLKAQKEKKLYSLYDSPPSPPPTSPHKVP